MTAGSLLEAGALVLLARLPVHGHYFADVFPAFLLFGTGSALVFVPGQIGAQAGVEPKDAGLASGLINTSQQVGGAIIAAVAVTLATTATNRYLHHHAAGHGPASAATVHGYHVAYLVLAIAMGVAGVLAGLLIKATPTTQSPAHTRSSATPPPGWPTPADPRADGWPAGAYTRAWCSTSSRAGMTPNTKTGLLMKIMESAEARSGEHSHGCGLPPGTK